MTHRTAAYWPTRMMLGVGVVATSIVVVVTIGMLLGAIPGFDGRATLFGVPTPLAIAVPALVGLAWMLRIFRGTRETRATWRHRDH